MGTLCDDQVEFVQADYGKTGVKLLYVNRNSARHDIKEVEGKCLFASSVS